MCDVNLYVGKVSSYKSVTRNRVQIELEEFTNVFELFVDQSWVLNKGDRIALSGQQDDTGKIVCWAYSNKDKGVNGWNYVESFIPVFIAVCFSLFLLVGGIGDRSWLFGVFSVICGFAAYGLWLNLTEKNTCYKKCLEMVECAK